MRRPRPLPTSVRMDKALHERIRRAHRLYGQRYESLNRFMVALLKTGVERFESKSAQQVLAEDSQDASS